MMKTKLCIDCKHYRIVHRVLENCSKFPSPVNGGAFRPCVEERHELGRCKTEARNFELKPVKQSRLSKIVTWAKGK